ncbi:hypothetical protein MXB_3023 [Myxobolus squamalis]|nr:hypothetical protein MXB_3023 [Myxobolus squamalis]
MTARNKSTHCSILHELIMLMRCNYMLSFITKNLEQELMAYIIWCKATKYGIVDDERRQLIDDITIIPTLQTDQICNFLMFTQQRLIPPRQNILQFLTHFRYTWMKRFQYALCILSNFVQHRLTGRIDNIL